MTYDELSRAEQQRLRDCYEAGFAAGSGRPWLIADEPETIALIERVADDWFCRLETAQAVARLDCPPLQPEEVPDWLRRWWEVQS